MSVALAGKNGLGFTLLGIDRTLAFTAQLLRASLLKQPACVSVSNKSPHEALSALINLIVATLIVT